MIHMQRKYNWKLILIHADRYEMKLDEVSCHETAADLRRKLDIRCFC